MSELIVVARPAQAQSSVLVTFGRPNVWSLEQSYEVLTKVVQRNIETSNPNGIRNRILSGLLVADPSITDNLAREAADNHLELQYELVAKQLTLLRDEVGPKRRLVFLELPYSVYFMPGEATNTLTQIRWTTTVMYSIKRARSTRYTRARAPAKVIRLYESADPGSSFGVGESGFGSVFNPPLGANGTKPGVRVNYVGLSIPMQTASIALSATVCYQRNGHKTLPPSSSVENRAAENATQVLSCIPDARTHVIPVPRGKFRPHSRLQTSSMSRSQAPYLSAAATKDHLKVPSGVTDLENNKGTQDTSIRPASYYYELGVKHNEDKRWSDAIELFKKAISIKPDYAQAHYKLGVAFFNLEQYGDAIAAFKRAAHYKPAYSDAYYNLGQSFIKLEQFKEALAVFKQYIKWVPEDPEGFFKLGFVHSRLGNHQEAVDAAKHSIRMRHDYADAYYNLGYSLSELGRFDEAVSAFRNYISLNPKDANGYSHLAANLSSLGQWSEAAGAYTEGINKLPYYERARLVADRGFIHLILRKGESAAADARLYLRLKGWQEELSLYMALLAHFGYRVSQNEQEALKILDEAILRGAPGNSRGPAIHLLLGPSLSKKWPYPILRYLHGDIPVNAVLEDIAERNKAEDKDIATASEAHLFIGWHLSLSNRLKEALPHLQWVTQNGDRQSVAYALAVSELRRVETSLRPPKD